MKGKVVYGVIFLWTCFIAFSLPICLAVIYQNITGHGKGYGYDMGSEKDVSIMTGCAELIIWLVLAVPSLVYLLKKTKEKGTRYLAIPLIIYVMLFVLCIQLIGGWSEYGRYFHA